MLTLRWWVTILTVPIKKSQVQVYTMEPALGNSPPLLLLLPQKADPNKFYQVSHWCLFLISLPIHALKDLKTTVWIHCSALESGLWWPGAPNLPSTTLGCVDPTLPVHLLSCALTFNFFGENIRAAGRGWAELRGGAALADDQPGELAKWIKRKFLGCDSGQSFPAALCVSQSPRVPCATSQSARGSLPPASSGGSYLRAFVAELRSGWGSIPKAKSHSSVRSKPTGSALTEHWRGTKEPLWDTCEDESEFVKIVCVYT